jgi:RNA polymerase sigma-70 factor (ECF subfamily)
VPRLIAPDLALRLHARAGASRWGLSPEAFATALSASARRAFGDRQPVPYELERFLLSLNLADLALACACAEGHGSAWDHLMAAYRPALYRMADHLDGTGGARELADAIWADLYGIAGNPGSRRSLLTSFHGRSTLATWLRSVLAQRHVDRFRTRRRERALPEDDAPAAIPAAQSTPDPERSRHVSLMRQGLSAALADVAPRERLRLRCYYAEGLTLAETGRVTGEHEATVSRQLARTRGVLRAALERFLASTAGLDSRQIAECFASLTADAGPLDLTDMLGGGDGRKKRPVDRSQEGPIR